MPFSSFFAYVPPVILKEVFLGASLSNVKFIIFVFPAASVAITSYFPSDRYSIPNHDEYIPWSFNTALSSLTVFPFSLTVIVNGFTSVACICGFCVFE